MTSFPVRFPHDFDDIISRSEALHRVELLASNEAFAKVMRGAMKGRYRERVKEGVVVDLRPFVGKVIRGEASMSMHGSPAAMCVEAGGPSGDLVLR